MPDAPMTNRTAWLIYAHALETFGYAMFTGILVAVVASVFTSAAIGVAAGSVAFLVTVTLRAAGAKRAG